MMEEDSKQNYVQVSNEVEAGNFVFCVFKDRFKRVIVKEAEEHFLKIDDEWVVRGSVIKVLRPGAKVFCYKKKTYAHIVADARKDQDTNEWTYTLENSEHGVWSVEVQNVKLVREAIWDTTIRRAAREEFDCPVCKCLLYQPCVLYCGHSCCKICFQQWMSHQRGRPRCPAGCNSPLPTRQLPKESILLQEIIRQRFRDEYTGREKEMETMRKEIQQQAPPAGHHPPNRPVRRGRILDQQRDIFRNQALRMRAVPFWDSLRFCLHVTSLVFTILVMNVAWKSFPVMKPDTAQHVFTHREIMSYLSHNGLNRKATRLFTLIFTARKDLVNLMSQVISERLLVPYEFWAYRAKFRFKVHRIINVSFLFPRFGWLFEVGANDAPFPPQLPWRRKISLGELLFSLFSGRLVWVFKFLLFIHLNPFITFFIVFSLFKKTVFEFAILTHAVQNFDQRLDLYFRLVRMKLNTFVFNIILFAFLPAVLSDVLFWLLITSECIRTFVEMTMHITLTINPRFFDNILRLPPVRAQ